ncbi:tRNA guanosine-2'-O-methyltransferase TRM13 [Scheffersomyces coipomensis]|uniref:tRNA guanosine-2'-O-methyltransferase TRM13 n=1 Tax=Scheffersomyces coipomensis TaxID=1788519 RepID=UPI00315D506C
MVPEVKKRKLNKKEQKVRLDQCEYFLPNKNRRCSMQRKADQKYCSQHLIHDEDHKDERVPCPLDPNHSVWVRDLPYHLQKCNSKPKEVREYWFTEDINCSLKTEGSDTSSQIEQESNEADVDEKGLYNKYIPLLQNITFDSLTTKISQHKGLHSRLSELSNQKHALQQSSLIGNMRDANLLGLDKFYVEFGCGRGELSRYVNACILEDLKDNKDQIIKPDSFGYGFVDRGLNRMKMDSKIIKDSSDSGIDIKIKRTRMDIKDLNLDKFIEDINPKKVVGISKHLCGAATDLTLKSILNSALLSDNIERFGGLMIAMCCRHACSYDQLLPQSKEYLAQYGFKTVDSFNILKKIVSWSVCGKGSKTAVDKEEDEEEAEQNHLSGLQFKQREQIGFIARRLIDESRVHALRSLLTNDKVNVEMFLYTTKDTTLEDVCLSITPV